MATLQRPVKEGSVRTYQEKVGLGFVDILASEMDADLDTIYAAWNGGTGNLADLAVTTPKLADGAVTSVKIANSAVRGTPSALGTAREIAKASIWAGDDLIDLSIPTSKIKIGATVRTQATVACVESAVSGATGLTFATLNVTLGGGAVVIEGALVGSLHDNTGSGTKWVQVQLLRGAGALRTWLVPVLQPTTMVVGMAFPIFFCEAPAAGAATYTLKVTTDANATFRSDLFAGTSRAGYLSAVEFA
jgi:hypothetical protein